MDPALIIDDAPADNAKAQGKLQNAFTLWVFMTSIANDGWKPRKMASFSTTAEFWNVYSYLKRPSDLEQGTQLNFFVKGVEPAWEDPANKEGGRWQLRFPTKINPDLSNKLWEDLVLGFIGEQFTYPDEVTGIVISIRKNMNTVSIWNRSGQDPEVKAQLRKDLVRIMGLGDETKMEYQRFNEEE